MSARSILSVPGLAATSDEFRRGLLAIANRHQWDVDALATVLSLESGFRAGAKNPLPNQTAVGILQFTAATLKSLGFEGTREDFARLSAVEQLPFVERYFVRAERSGRLVRPVDYYLVVLGFEPGLPDSHVIAAEDGPRAQTYELNKSLDADGNGVILVSDLAARMQTQAGRAKGERIDVLGAEVRRASAGGWLVLGALGVVAVVKGLRRGRAA